MGRREHDVFDKSDFRGLLHADYQDTLRTVYKRPEAVKLSLQTEEPMFEVTGKSTRSVSTKNERLASKKVTKTLSNQAVSAYHDKPGDT